MNKKVSIIIPNYNAGKYILKCMDSVIKQTYKNIELIVIDDGSNDGSWSIIQEYAKRNENISILHQQNLNASIARNRGIEVATGEYLIFLDSDDILYQEAIEKMVSKIERDQSDMVIGNFYITDKEGNPTRKCIFTDRDRIEENPILLNKIAPNPSNKLYKSDFIKRYDIVFGNVRIGQDLNFYLKYLLKCKKVSLISDFIYGWRKVPGSISNNVSFRIFDITESFKDLRNFYSKENGNEIYNNYIKMVEYRHYYLQMEKQINFPDKKSRDLVVNYFSYHLKQLNVKSCLNFSENADDYKKCIIKMRFAMIYKSIFYRKLLQIVNSKKK